MIILLPDMIKYSNEGFLTKITNLFNAIMKNESYPTKWNHDLVTPIFKHGKKSDPSNYRGISLTKSLGKLFSIILQKRIEVQLDQEKILSLSQAGFSKHRTAI